MCLFRRESQCRGHNVAGCQKGVTHATSKYNCAHCLSNILGIVACISLSTFPGMKLGKWTSKLPHQRGNAVNYRPSYSLFSLLLLHTFHWTQYGLIQQSHIICIQEVIAEDMVGDNFNPGYKMQAAALFSVWPNIVCITAMMHLHCTSTVIHAL